MISDSTKIIFDSGILITAGHSLQLLVYWNPNIKLYSPYPSVGYLEIELNRDGDCLFSVLFFDEINSQANEIPDFFKLELSPDNNALLTGFLPLSKKPLILKSSFNILTDNNIRFINCGKDK